MSGFNSVKASRTSGNAWKNGEMVTIDWIVEQTSWRNPGNVSSSVRHPPPGLDAPSKTSTESPARASVSAAAKPLGPDPTTTASSDDPLSSQFEHRAWLASDDAGIVAESSGDRVEFVVGTALLVVEERDPRHVRVTSQRHRVLGRGVTEVRLGLQLLAHQLRVVNEYVGALAQGQRGLVVLAQVVGARARGRSDSGRACRRRVEVPSLMRKP